MTSSQLSLSDTPHRAYVDGRGIVRITDHLGRVVQAWRYGERVAPAAAIDAESAEYALVHYCDPRGYVAPVSELEPGMREYCSTAVAPIHDELYRVVARDPDSGQRWVYDADAADDGDGPYYTRVADLGQIFLDLSAARAAAAECERRTPEYTITVERCAPGLEAWEPVDGSGD